MTKEQWISRRNGRRGADSQADKYLRRYPLSGKIICAKCGHTLKRRIWNYGKSGERVHLLCNGYISRGKEKCDQKGISMDAVAYALNDAIKEYLIVSREYVTSENNVETLKLLEEIKILKKDLASLLDRIVSARTEYEKDILNEKYEDCSLKLDEKIKLFNNLKNCASFATLSEDRVNILTKYINATDSELTREIVDTFLTAGLQIDAQTVIFIISNSKDITNAQIAASRLDIARMPGLFEKTVICRKGIKNYTVNYRVVAL